MKISSKNWASLLETFEYFNVCEYKRNGIWVSSPSFEGQRFITHTDLDLLVKQFVYCLKQVNSVRELNSLLD